ncbi:MAG: methyltransferase domain-containing protein [Myxococcota bacterium]
MLKLIPLVLWLTIALTSVGCGGGLTKVDVGRVLTSGRDGWQHPERVMNALALRPGDRVAEIGAGSGYGLAHLSEAVGPDGRVYAVEVEADLVRALEARVARDGFDNVEVVFGAYDDPKLPDGGVDVAMTCLTYHHIEDRVVYFRALKRDLAPAARVIHLDDRPDAPAPISWFQNEGHWTEPERILREMGEAGYDRTARHDFLPSQSFQVFAPNEAATSAGVVER